MRIPFDPPVDLVYCLNVFPGDGIDRYADEILPAMQRVRSAMGMSETFGLGLFLDGNTMKTLQVPAERERFLACVREYGFSVPTCNAFPMQPFHGQPVKQDVYTPDWRSRERLVHTLHTAELLANFLPEGGEGSVSTAPGAYYSYGNHPEDRAQIVKHLREAADALHGLEERTGRCVHLGVEPEPDGMLESTEDFISFYEDELLCAGKEDRIRRHLGICFDTCHLAIQFENLTESVARFRSAGIRLSKVHISAALECSNTPEALHQLAAFEEPVYLHQTRLHRPDGVVMGWPDLKPALHELPKRGAGTVRVHFHVPVDDPDLGGLQSTSHLLDPAFFRAALDAGCTIFEVETYTFHVIPEHRRVGGLEEQMVRELSWAAARLRHG